MKHQHSLVEHSNTSECSACLPCLRFHDWNLLSSTHSFKNNGCFSSIPTPNGRLQLSNRTVSSNAYEVIGDVMMSGGWGGTFLLCLLVSMGKEYRPQSRGGSDRCGIVGSRAGRERSCFLFGMHHLEEAMTSTTESLRGARLCAVGKPWWLWVPAGFSR